MMTFYTQQQKKKSNELKPVWTNFHSMGHGAMYRGAVSLIFHKFHIKPSACLRFGLSWQPFIFDSLSQSGCVYVFVSFLCFFFGGDSFIISLCWGFSNNKWDERWKITCKRKERTWKLRKLIKDWFIINDINN